MAPPGPLSRKRKRGHNPETGERNPKTGERNPETGGRNPHVDVIEQADGKITTSGGPLTKSSLIQHERAKRVSHNEKAKPLQFVRKQLPIWRHRNEIREALNEKDVLILVGETGSGKSTQVPQFLLDCHWLNGGKIAITQPRRVAAISLARRVAAEMGSTLGSSSPASKVGYSVRFDSSTSPAMRVKYLTEGMLLQELLRDPWLKSYSVVVVDEVHERSVNVDLILGFLRRIVTGEAEGPEGRKQRLKVVIMSATADTEGLVRFFEDGFLREDEAQKQDAVAGVDNGYSETSWSGISSSDDEETRNGKSVSTDKHNSIVINGKVIRTVPIRSKPAKIDSPSVQPNGKSKKKDTESHPHVSVCLIEGRQYPVETFYMPGPSLDFMEDALKTIFQVHFGESLPGDILVFLTGQDTVETLKKLVQDYSTGMASEMPKVSN